MLKSNVTKAKALSEAMRSHEELPESSPNMVRANTEQTPFRLVSPTTGEMRAMLARDQAPDKHVPPWLRPFFSLQVQLLVVYSLLLALVVMLVTLLLTSVHPLSTVYIVAVTLSAIALGSILAFVFTSLLLRPLWRVTDAAQAIALGDLKQRERLPLRQPPQDEIDRLAGSLDEMVTRLERAEEQQHASEQRFKRFFSDASHQLRTPLTSIRGFTEVLMRGAKDDPETAQRVLNRMKSEGQRMTDLINDLLTLARLDDSQPLKTQCLDLVELTMQEVEQVKASVKGGNTISFVLATEQRLGIQADKERIKQLLFILLDNALKHGQPAPQGKITLELGKQEKQSVIRVIDNGEGIAKEDLVHIFDTFYRGQPQRSGRSSNTPGVGTGLGLTIAVAIVRAHHGTLSVYSEPGRGTEFRVTLPCVD